jgi:hypothetical protein
MDLTRQYIIQALVVAANNLRLNSEKIESVAILREHLKNSENLFNEIQRFKKITQLSKLGIKLGELHTTITCDSIDFLKVTELFKSQSSSLVIILSNFLDIISPTQLRDILYTEREEEIETSEEEIETTKEETPPIEFDCDELNPESDELTKEIIMDELEDDKESESEDFNFEDYQKKILSPIKKIEELMVKLLNGNVNEVEIRSYIDVMKNHAEYSDKIGFSLIANMHVTFTVGLKLIADKKIVPDKNVIESLRACLIVIVAVVKRKEVDITNYLNRAESFGKQIIKYK